MTREKIARAVRLTTTQKIVMYRLQQGHLIHTFETGHGTMRCGEVAYQAGEQIQMRTFRALRRKGLLALREDRGDSRYWGPTDNAERRRLAERGEGNA